MQLAKALCGNWRFHTARGMQHHNRNLQLGSLAQRLPGSRSSKPQAVEPNWYQYLTGAMVAGLACKSQEPSLLWLILQAQLVDLWCILVHPARFAIYFSTDWSFWTARGPLLPLAVPLLCMRLRRCKQSIMQIVMH